MSNANPKEQLIFLVTVVSLGEDPLGYDKVVGAFSNEPDAKKLWQELTDELDDDSGTRYFLEETWLRPKTTLPEMSEG